MWPFLTGQAAASPRDTIPISGDCLVHGDWKVILGKTAPDFWQGPSYPNSSSASLEDAAPSRPYPFPTVCAPSDSAQEWTLNTGFTGSICGGLGCFNVQQSKTNIILWTRQDDANEQFSIQANGSLVGALRGECVRVNGFGEQHTFGACDQLEWRWGFSSGLLSVTHTNGTKWCIAAHAAAPGPAPPSPPAGDHCASGCLFNVVRDPTEQSNVYEQNPSIVASMKKSLDDLKGTFFQNHDKFENDCPSGSGGNCACWMAKNRYGGFMGPFAMTNAHTSLVV